MQYRTLGKTGWKVSEIGFGAWGIGGQWGPVEKTTALDAVQAALDCGVNFFDTADSYGIPPGSSEEFIGEALKGIRQNVFIATKVGNFGRRTGHPLPYTDASHVELCCDSSLFRLKTDRIDLYQSHIGNGNNVEVFLEAFETLISKGKIRAYAVSTNSLEVVRSYNQNGNCAAVQLEYSLLFREAEAELLNYCGENNIGTIIRGPLAKGVLTGKFDSNTRFEDEVRGGWNEGKDRDTFLSKLKKVEELRFLEKPDRSLGQSALQFVLSNPHVTTVIPGAKNRLQAEQNAVGFGTLSSEEIKRINSLD